MNVTWISTSNEKEFVMHVVFSATEFWDFGRDSIILLARVEGRPVRCVVPQEMLTSPFVYPPAEEKNTDWSRRPEVAVAEITDW